MNSRSSLRWSNPGWAVPAVAAALAVQLVLQGLSGAVAPLATFYLAVTVAALKGGRPGGFLAVALSPIVANYFLMEPALTLAVPSRDDAIRIALFSANGAIIAEICARYRSSLSTAERLKEEAVKSAKLLEAIGAASPDLIYAKDRSFRTIYANAATLRTLGLSESDVLGRTAAEYASQPQEGEQHASNDARVMETGQVEVADEVFTSPDGSRRIFRSSKAPLRDLTGEIVGIAGVSVDVAEQRAMAAELQRSERRLRLALQAGRMAVWDHDAIQDKLASTPELNQLLGFPANHPLTIAEVRARYVAGERDRLLHVVGNAIAAGDRYAETELRYHHPDGSLRTFVISAELTLTEQGQLARTNGVLLDITRLRSAETDLLEREAELAAALDAGKLAVVDFDHLSGRFRHSSRLNELYGYPSQHQLTLEDVRRRYHPDHAPLVFQQRDEDAANPLQTGFSWKIQLLMPDGAEKWVEGLGEYVRDDAGAIVRSRGVLMDVTERVRAERHQALLIAELNHRVRNTLSVVQSIARHSFRGSNDADALRAFETRLGALAAAHKLLTQTNWEPSTLRGVVEASLAPFIGSHPAAFDISGPAVSVSAKAAVNLALAFTELGTNASKYGALTSSAGRVRVTWTVSGDGSFELDWIERGGPTVTPPSGRGFGSKMISRALAVELDGSVDLTFEPEGVKCRVTAAAAPRVEVRPIVDGASPTYQ